MANASCPGIVPNPDLVGIGTRLNFYVTIFLAALIPQSVYTTELLDSLYMNAVFYGLALLVTVVVQTIQGQLDLYHAIFVMHMVACLSVLHLYGINRFILANRFSFKMQITFAVQVFQVLFVFTPWSLYVWIKDTEFGSQPECNNLIKYVVLFINVRATVRWLRILSIVSLSSGSLSSLVGLGMMLIARKDPTAEEPEEPEDEPSSWFFWVVSVVSAAYGVVTTELVVHRNHPHVQAGEDSWGFGQIVSIILILPIIIEVLATIKRWSSGRYSL